MKTPNAQPRIVNIYNFIREIEPRVEGYIRGELYQATLNEIDLIKSHGLPATYALQYDALVDERYQQLLKERLDDRDEIGAWWEIVQGQAEAAGLEWRGRFPWDWHPDVGFSTGYTPEEREKLVDVYMARFREIFGYYPRTVGSWFIDSHSLSYMHEKYGIVASCNCKDQIGTDGYTLHGGYWNQAYYPSRKNAYMPAQTEAGQIPVPIFRMLGSDPVNQYDYQLGEEIQYVKTLEPVSLGASPEWVRWFFDLTVNQPCLAFAYVQVGQENSFTWSRIKDGLEIQIPLVAELAKAGQVRVETLEQSGCWFREQFKVTPPTSVVALTDSESNGRQSVWYNSRFYRINFIFEHGGLRIRDLHLFDEEFTSLYLKEPLRAKIAEYTTLPVLDGNSWSTAQEIAGMRLVHKAEHGYIPLTTKLVDVVESSATELLLQCELAGGGTLEIHCRENSVEFMGDGLESYALLMTWSDDKDTSIESVTTDCIHYLKRDFPYHLTTSSGHIATTEDKAVIVGIVLAADRNKRLVLECAIHPTI